MAIKRIGNIMFFIMTFRWTRRDVRCAGHIDIVCKKEK